MKRVIAWAISNSPGMNVLMIGLMVMGAVSMWRLRRETFPAFELEIVMASVMYPGTSPEDVEEGICQKIEEAVRSIDGIKQVTSIAQEGAGYVLMELRTDVRDVQKVLAEVDREVARIPTFPEMAEDPSVEQITFRTPAIRVGIIAPAQESADVDAEWRLREVVEKVLDELLLLPAVSSASVMGGRPYQLDVEIPEATLRSYGLSLEQVAGILRSQNIELPGGNLKSEGQDVLLRAKNKGRVGDEIAKIPVITQPGGTVLTVADLGRVTDRFEDIAAISEINGQPAMVINIERTKTEDLLAMVKAVREYVDRTDLPDGYRFAIWNDTSVEVQGRLDLLKRNGIQGLLLVFLVLTLFLEMRLAFWVALGIPIAILGAGVALEWGGQTLNMLSLFSFLMALGIVVDDAIVIGENIYAHRQMGKGYRTAAIDGATEVLPSVAASVTTTIIAFSPMFFVSGVMGKFMAVIPFAVIAMLVISLWESMFVLPCHLGHSHSGFFRVAGVLMYPLRPVGMLLRVANEWASESLSWVSERFYEPMLRFSLRHPAVPIAVSISMALVTYGMVRGGVVVTVLFPKTDNNLLHATITFPDGTAASIADAATRRMEEAIREVSREEAQAKSEATGIPIEDVYPNEGSGVIGPVQLTFREVGSIAATDGVGAGARPAGGHVGQIFVELFDTEIRDVHSDRLIERWRQKVGEIPGAERVTFGTIGVGPGGKAIEFKLLASANATDDLEQVSKRVQAKLAEYAGVYDIADDNSPGKWEFQYAVRDTAVSTGVKNATLGETVRNAYYGAEAMRLQRGRHEVKLMVRYPEEERTSLVNFREVRVRDELGVERPFSEVAQVTLGRGFSEINRLDQRRSVTVTADVDEASANADLITDDLQNRFLPELLAEYPEVSVRWQGQREQSQESVGSLINGFGYALLAMFVLLVLQFRSYIQPVLILAVIPFGMIGAVWGHALLGLPLTLFSMFGLVALAGVVVNDSIVLIDFINARLRDGMDPFEALVESGRRRFRPIVLTSLTTIAGLAPLLTEKSFQAQLLIPMAASLAFGLMLATMQVLLLIPVFYAIYLRALNRFGQGTKPATKAV
ncbi:MAG: efflux RND transporter permease subunit [Planctomycetaceae bacterium]|nr:MAG: efflux RND transporter permease subunit [Planctomycetaceae bacterium]